MNARQKILFVTTLVLIGSTVGLLAWLKSAQKLGAPGVRVAAVPIYYPDGTLGRSNSVPLPLQVLDYKSEPLAVTEVELKFFPADTTYGRRQYSAPDGFQAALGVVLMGTDRTSIHKPQICMEAQGWKIQRSDEFSVPMSAPQPYGLSVMRLIGSKLVRLPDGHEQEFRMVFVYWFVADGLLTARHTDRMWWMAKDLLSNGVLERWAYVMCFSACLPGQEDATFGRLKQFIASATPEFQLTPPPKKN